MMQPAHGPQPATGPQPSGPAQSAGPTTGRLPTAPPAGERSTTVAAGELPGQIAAARCTALAAWLLVCWAGTAAGSAPAWLSQEATLRDVTFIDADRGWCVGDCGVILRSDDSGLSWRPQDSATTANLLAIGMFNSQRGLAIGGSFEPHTQIGRGTVLLTDDGGENWRPAASMALPPLRQVLLGPRGRCVAAADWSPVHHSNLFTSFDGGATWEAMPGAGPGAIIDLAGSVDDFLALSDRGELTRLRDNHPDQQIMPPAARWTTLCGDGDLRWLSGPQAALFSPDRGATWQAVPVTAAATHPPAIAGSASAACLHAGELWSIDATGKTIARHGVATPGQPHIAQPHICTSEASLRAIFRLGQDRGWAVGDWGTILVTRDGGQSWRSVRGDDSRAAVMAVAPNGYQLPWSLLAIESQQHLRRVAIVTGGRQSDDDEELLVRDAAKLIGPIAQHRCDGSSTAIRSLLQSAPPAVLVLDQSLAAEEKTAWTSIAIECGIRRVFETGRGNGQNIHYASSLPGSGRLAGDVWTDALWLLRPGALPPEQLQLGPRFDTVSSQVAADGLASCVGTDRRYGRQAEAGTSRRYLQILQARGGEAAWVEALVNSPAAVSERVEQFEVTLPRIAEENRQRLVFRILTASKLRDEHQLYRAMLRQAAQAWPNEPFGRLCDLHDQAIGTSEEWQRMVGTESFMLQSNSQARATAPHAVQWSPFQSVVPATAVVAMPPSGSAAVQTLPIGGGVQLAGGTEPLNPTAAAQIAAGDALANEPLSVAGRPLAEHPHRTPGHGTLDMHWQSHPAVLLARRSAAERVGAAGQNGAAASAGAGSWAELLQTVATPAALRAAWAAQRPLLDGELSESIWTAGQSFPLPAGAAAELRTAYDADFLYLAIAAPALRGEADQPGPRSRDTPLDHQDRYVIRIDVDGDLLTAYELEFDAAGKTRDTCDGFTHWQPRWFIAIGGEPGRTIAEIAIQKSDLVGPLQQLDRPWKISLQRRLPGQLAPTVALSRPEQWRRLIFD